MKLENPLKLLYWIEELLPTEVVTRPMHGGLGYYLDQKLILILTEASFTYEHKGRSFPFQIWNGAIVPVEQIKQSAVWVGFQFLENHPANRNWLYLPADTEEFEEKIKLITRQIKKRNPLFGVPLKIKAQDIDESEISTARPSMFVQVPITKVEKEKKSRR